MPAPSRRRQIEEMLEADPKDAFLRYALAMEIAAENDPADAVRTFQELIAESPDYVPAYFQCGQLLLRLGQAGEGKTMLQQGIAAARRAGDLHAAGEMEGLLQSLPDGG